jgi:hypothetical protein
MVHIVLVRRRANENCLKTQIDVTWYLTPQSMSRQAMHKHVVHIP